MKEITLDAIKSGDLIGKPTQITVELVVKGELRSFTTYLRPYSYSTAIANMTSFSEKREALAGMIATSICDENGNDLVSEDDVRKKFSEALVHALWIKIVEINALGKPLKSKKRTRSSVKSQSQQVGQSKKLKNSHTQKSSSGQPIDKNTEALTTEEGLSKK